MPLRLGWGRHRRDPGAPAEPAEGPLTTWSAGQTGEVLEVTPASPLSARLRELGVTPGCPVRVLRSGSPLVIQVGGGRFCLRREDAACIRARRTERPSLADAAG